jgi:TonB family C-terminal domain
MSIHPSKIIVIFIQPKQTTMRTYFLLLFLTTVLFKAQAQVSSDSIKQNESVVTSYQIPPKFPGGDTALTSFIAKTLVYPKDALKKKIEGTVYVKFAVEKDGSVTDIIVVRALCPSCDQAAMDVMKKSPKWKPGYNGATGLPEKIWIATRVKFVLP